MNNGYEQGYEQVMNNPSDLKRHSPLIPPIEKDRERNNDVKSSDPVPRTPAHAREGTGTGAGTGTAPEPQTGSGSVAFRHFSGSGTVPEMPRRHIPITKELILYGEIGDGRIVDPVQTALLVLRVPTIDTVNGVTYNNARIWRSILHDIGERAFRDALYRQYRENDIDGNPRSRAATFQAKLNALKYGKGGAQ